MGGAAAFGRGPPMMVFIIIFHLFIELYSVGGLLGVFPRACVVGLVVSI